MFEQTSRGRVPERSTQAQPAPADLPGERDRGVVSAKALLTTAPAPDRRREEIEGPTHETTFRQSAKI
jgi:hypothetical protein